MLKLLGICFFSTVAFFWQCEKGASEAGSRVNREPAASVETDVSPTPANMNEIFSSSGEKDGIAYRFVGRLQTKGRHDGVEYPNDNLVIEYELKNTTGRDFILFNQGHSGSGSAVVYAEPGADGTVEISQRAFQEPAGKNCPARFVAVTPRGAWLKANATFADKVYFELPLKTLTPFDDCESAAQIAADAAKVRFCLGYAEAAAGAKIDDDGNVNPLPEVKNQRLMCSDTGALR